MGCLDLISQSYGQFPNKNFFIFLVGLILTLESLPQEQADCLALATL